jgi:hypothetical protein
MSDGEWLVQQFEESRGRLRAVAYPSWARMAKPTTPFRRACKPHSRARAGVPTNDDVPQRLSYCGPPPRR